MLYAVRYVQYYVVRHSVIVGPFPDPPVLLRVRSRKEKKYKKQNCVYVVIASIPPWIYPFHLSILFKFRKRVR